MIVITRLRWLLAVPILLSLALAGESAMAWNREFEAPDNIYRGELGSFGSGQQLQYEVRELNYGVYTGRQLTLSWEVEDEAFAQTIFEEICVVAWSLERRDDRVLLSRGGCDNSWLGHGRRTTEWTYSVASGAFEPTREWDNLVDTLVPSAHFAALESGDLAALHSLTSQYGLESAINDYRNDIVPEALRLTWELALAHHHSGRSFEAAAIARTWLIPGFAGRRGTESDFQICLTDDCSNAIYLEDTPLNTLRLNDLAYVLTSGGFFDDAVPILREVVRLSPDRAVAWLNLADALWDARIDGEVISRALTHEAYCAYAHYSDLRRLVEGPDVRLPDRVSARSSIASHVRQVVAQQLSVDPDLSVDTSVPLVPIGSDAHAFIVSAHTADGDRLSIVARPYNGLAEDSLILLTPWFSYRPIVAGLWALRGLPERELVDDMVEAVLALEPNLTAELPVVRDDQVHTVQLLLGGAPAGELRFDFARHRFERTLPPRPSPTP